MYGMGTGMSKVKIGGCGSGRVGGGGGMIKPMEGANGVRFERERERE
jgi:hypothetical protein